MLNLLNVTAEPVNEATRKCWTNNDGIFCSKRINTTNEGKLLSFHDNQRMEFPVLGHEPIMSIETSH